MIHAENERSFILMLRGVALALTVYPLLVTESGRRGGKPLQANFKLAFGVSKGAYVVPEEVSAGY